MRYTEERWMQLLGELYNSEEHSVEDEIEFNILNFLRSIRTIGGDFIDTPYRTQHFGALPMSFRKKAGQMIGLITVEVNDEMQRYVFNGEGYEKLEDLLKLG